MKFLNTIESTTDQAKTSYTTLKAETLPPWTQKETVTSGVYKTLFTIAPPSSSKYLYARVLGGVGDLGQLRLYDQSGDGPFSLIYGGGILKVLTTTEITYQNMDAFTQLTSLQWDNIFIKPLGLILSSSVVYGFYVEMEGGQNSNFVKANGFFQMLGNNSTIYVSFLGGSTYFPLTVFSGYLGQN